MLICDRMAQQLQFSSYYYKLDAKLKARYLSLIKEEDPYALRKADLRRDANNLPSLR